MTETTRSDSPSRGMRSAIARRLIASFANRFKQPHLYFAQHAAFPMALTPDLLYRLWINFRRNTKGEMLNIPWIAVADLLLSPLCNEVGHELYEMDVTVRTELLEALKDNSGFGQKRINELSDFLLDYVQKQLHSSDLDIRDLAQVQRWIALAYTQPGRVTSELAKALVRVLEQDNKIEQVRIASLMETLGGLAEPLADLEEFSPLLTYARGVGHLAYGDIESANVQFNAVQTPEKLEQALGVRLPIAGQVRRGYETIVQQARDTGKDFFISYHSADRDWAEWIAWRLEEAGYSIILQVWNFQVGANFSYALDTITKIAVHVLFILSPDFLKAFAAMPDWASAFDKDPRSMAEQQILMAVQVRECMSEVEALVGGIVYTDLVGLDEKEAYAIIGKDIISKMPIRTPGNKQRVIFERPRFPGTPQPRFLVPSTPIEIFISYADQDQEYLRELESQLAPLTGTYRITIWHKGKVIPGQEYERQVDKHLKAAHIILLLVSSSYLASDYLYTHDMQRAMEYKKAGTAEVIPVLLHAVYWKDAPFGELKPLPENRQPVSQWPDKGDAFYEIALGVRKAVKTVVEQLQAESVTVGTAEKVTDIPDKGKTVAYQLFSHGYALLIGVGNDLPVTVKDAIALHDVLVNPARAAYPPDHVQLLTEAQATRQNILAAFEQLAQRVQIDPEATAIVYFSGHGGRFKQPDKPTEYFLVPYGYDPIRRTDTAISGPEFTSKIDAISARKLVVVLDCMYAAGILSPKEADETFEKAPLPADLPHIFQTGSSRVLVASSRENEVSYTGTPYSVFTACLIEALTDKAVREKDSFVHILDVLSYLFDTVPERTSDRQHPLVYGIQNLSDNFALCYYAGGSKEVPGEALSPSPTPSAASMTLRKRRELEERRDMLLTERTLRVERLKRVRKAWVIEQNPIIRFQHEQEIQEDEAEIARLDRELDEIEQALQ